MECPEHTFRKLVVVIYLQYTFTLGYTHAELDRLYKIQTEHVNYDRNDIYQNQTTEKPIGVHSSLTAQSE